MTPEAERNPWTTLDRREVYANPWITVFEDRVIRPDGEPGIYGVVHFPNVAVGVLAVDADGRIVLVGQYRYTIRSYSWEIPEGAGRPGESAEESARRELREETGFSAGGLDRINTAHLSNSVSDELAIVFRATHLTPGASSPEGTERLQVRWFAWEEAWRMVEEGRITDSMTVIALMHEAVRRGASHHAVDGPR